MNKKIKNQVLVIKAIVPFDGENIENLNDMKFKFDVKRSVKVVGDKVGKKSLVKLGYPMNEKGVLK